MSDRYKNEIEKILEGTPDLPEQPMVEDEPDESLKDELVALFFDARNRKIGSISAFNISIASIVLFALFFVIKVNLFAVAGITCLLVSYLTFIWPTSLQRPRLYFDNLLSWFKGLGKKTDE
ncbi:MAG: hypothetical protein VYE36_06520 [Chloroflexota bacterium]|nr:hypothetical protein [Chloroflexota bacterium]